MKTDNNNNFTKQNRADGFMEVSENNKRHEKKSKILICCLIAVLLICVVAAGVFFISSEVFHSHAQVKVAFDSTGGSEIESQAVLKGGALTEVGTPVRNGYVFAGWYYEEAPVNVYKESDIFLEDTMLYAAWYQPEMKVDKAEHIKDCQSDITFVVRSEAELTQDNLAEYIYFSVTDFEDGKTLSVKRQNDGYLLYSQDGYTPGNTYSIEILDTNTVGFIKAGEEDVSGLGITNYNFTVYKENVNNVVLKAEPKLLSSDDVSDFELAGEVADGETGNENDNGKEIYRAVLIKEDDDYKIGDILSFGSGKKDADENQYYKVIHVVKNNEGYYLDVITPNIDEIYSEFELYYSGDAAYFEEDDESTGELEQSLKTSLMESEGYDYLCTAIARGIKESPTLKDTVATLDANNQKRFENLSISAIKDLLKNVSFDISFGKTKDDANNDNGCYGRIKFTTGDININLDKNVKLTLKLSMSEDITSTAYGWFCVKNAKLYADKGVYLDNKFDMSFSAVIATTSGTVNITDEIQKLVDSQSADKTQAIVDSLNKEDLFGGDLDYVEILSKQLGEKTITVYEVLSIQFTLDFKVSVGMRAGLDLNFNTTELRKVGMCNIDYSAGSLEASRTKMETFSKRLKSTLHFDATLKGKVGIRAGFEAGVNFSVLHLNKVFNFGFAAEVGVYEEISGYLRFDYDYKNDAGDSSSSMNLAGGLKSETGIYVALSFSWNVFGWDDAVTIAEMKFPILTIGSLEFASEFETNDNAITFDTNSYNIKNSSDNLLKLKYIDISGGADGVTINIKPASSSGDYKFYAIQDQTGKGSKDDIRYVSVDANSGMISIADNAPERLDFTVLVQYTKGCSLFSKDMELITKNINFTYMKYKVADSTKKYKAAFYAPDGSVIEQKEYYVGQIPVPPAEDTYDDLFAFTQYKLISWARPWKEDIKAIYADTAYHLDYDLNYKNISFYGAVNSEQTGKYEHGLLATVPTLVGEMPIPPASVEMDIEPGWEFDSWSPELREVQTDYNYSACYRQDPDYCWTSFYLDNTRISAEYVKKGTLPEAPDMSRYNTDDQQFVGWWPSLHVSSNNSEVYYAVFNKYVNVTFKDADGKIISEQRVLSGKTPEAPKVEEVIEGDEDYYENRFSHWATDKGAKLGPVYSDTEFSPVYDKHYLEVTTIFDAGAHTFADGTKIKEFNGTYAPYNFLYLPQVTYRDNENTYTVDYWQSTERVNGSYVKLYMSGFYTDYKYNMTFTPVFKKEAAIEYTVRFYGGDKAVYLTGHYGDVITADMLTGLKKTSTVNNYVYVLKDYGLTLPYKFGTMLGADGLPAVYISVMAKFELVGINNTFTFDANGGKFADNETVKTVTGSYGTRASFTEEPAKADDDRYIYEFVGWSDNKDSTSGSSFSDFVINGNSTFYAIYSKTLKNYTVTFDAGEGHFDGGSSTVVQTYHYGDTIVPPADPVREADTVYRYVFLGWQPTLTAGTKVTAGSTYTATYRAIRVDGTLEETGIIVSDGSSYEDICANHISGYTYALVGTQAIPTLTVTGNGLEFSGTSGEVCVVIESGVTDVMFNDLTLSGAYTDANAVLDMEDTATQLTIHIKGSCVIRNTENAKQAARFERPVLLTGSGANAALAISAKGHNASVYCANTLSVDLLELEIAAQKREGDASFPVTPIGGDGSGGDWLFTNSTIRFVSQGNACEIISGIRLLDSSLTAVGEAGMVVAGDIRLSGASTVDVTASGAGAVALQSASLIFDDFTGSFSAGSTHATSPGTAVMAFGSILFRESGLDVSADKYNLGGTEIGTFHDDVTSSDYASFGIRTGETLVPAASVTVTP